MFICGIYVCCAWMLTAAGAAAGSALTGIGEALELLLFTLRPVTLNLLILLRKLHPNSCMAKKPESGGKR